MNTVEFNNGVLASQTDSPRTNPVREPDEISSAWLATLQSILNGSALPGMGLIPLDNTSKTDLVSAADHALANGSITQSEYDVLMLQLNSNPPFITTESLNGLIQAHGDAAEGVFPPEGGYIDVQSLGGLTEIFAEWQAMLADLFSENRSIILEVERLTSLNFDALGHMNTLQGLFDGSIDLQNISEQDKANLESTLSFLKEHNLITEDQFNSAMNALADNKLDAGELATFEAFIGGLQAFIDANNTELSLLSATFDSNLKQFEALEPFMSAISLIVPDDASGATRATRATGAGGGTGGTGGTGGAGGAGGTGGTGGTGETSVTDYITGSGNTMPMVELIASIEEQVAQAEAHLKMLYLQQQELAANLEEGIGYQSSLFGPDGAHNGIGGIFAPKQDEYTVTDDQKQEILDAAAWALENGGISQAEYDKIARDLEDNKISDENVALLEGGLDKGVTAANALSEDHAIKIEAATKSYEAAVTLLGSAVTIEARIKIDMARVAKQVAGM